MGIATRRLARERTTSSSGGQREGRDDVPEVGKHLVVRGVPILEDVKVGRTGARRPRSLLRDLVANLRCGSGWFQRGKGAVGARFERELAYEDIGDDGSNTSESGTSAGNDTDLG